MFHLVARALYSALYFAAAVAAERSAAALAVAESEIAFALASARILSEADFVSTASLSAAALSAARPAFSAARRFAAACASSARPAFSAASCAVSVATVPFRSDTVNAACAALIGAVSPATVAAEVAPVTTTVTVPATPIASDAVLEPATSVVSAVASAVVDVTSVFVTVPSANVDPSTVAVNVSPVRIALPKTSVADTVTVGMVPTADAAGTATATFDAVPAIPLTYTTVEYAPFVMVTVPTFTLVVYAYTVTAAPADVTDRVDDPDAIVFGESVVCKAVTSLTVSDATNDTIVEVSAVAAIAKDVPDVIWFADGTATDAGAADVVELATVATVTDNGAADAGETGTLIIARAAAVAIDSFLNDFILFISP